MTTIKGISIVLGVVAAIAVASVAGYMLGDNALVKEESTTSTAMIDEEQPLLSKEPDTGSATTDSTETQLLYLIEEEKLAHDVYTVLYDKYGARVFGNILQSENTHQERVLSLLEQRNIADPRKDAVGKFTDPDLQKLYDDLIAKGMKSEKDAYEVGVTIEEVDIADITKQLETASDVDVIQTLEDLRRGSENHLRAFNRQLNR